MELTQDYTISHKKKVSANYYTILICVDFTVEVDKTSQQPLNLGFKNSDLVAVYLLQQLYHHLQEQGELAGLITILLARVVGAHHDQVEVALQS